jgi:hypothetical protein
VNLRYRLLDSFICGLWESERLAFLIGSFSAGFLGFAGWEAEWEAVFLLAVS